MDSFFNINYFDIEIFLQKLVFEPSNSLDWMKNIFFHPTPHGLILQHHYYFEIIFEFSIAWLFLIIASNSID